MAGLREVTDLRVRNKEAVADAKEAGEKLMDLLERGRKDDEEARKVREERAELSRVVGELESQLGAARRESERTLGEGDEARQECLAARRERNTAEDQREEAIRTAEQLTGENSQMKTTLQSLQVAVNKGRERDLTKGQVIEGLKTKLAEVDTELTSTREALATERHDHSELRTAVERVCGALGLGSAGPGVSSMRGRLGMAFERVRTLARGALHLGVRRAFGVFRSHYEQIDLEALNGGYVEAPDEELEAVDDEVLAPATTLASHFEDEVVPPPLDL